MRIVFMGAVEEGWLTLQAILQDPARRRDFSAIVTLREDKGRRLSGYRSFHDLGRGHGLPVHEIDHVRSPEAIALLRRLSPDLLIVVGWTQLLSDEALRIPPLGSVGLHTTLLPKHRGRAPIPWAIIKGLGKSGNTLFFLTPGVDDGDIIGQKSFYLALDDDAESVYRKATQSGIDLLLEHLEGLKTGTAPRRPQNRGQVDVWPGRRPEDGLIDWDRSALEIHNLIRGVTRPYPGAFTFHRGRKLLIWKSRLLGSAELDLDVRPGAILDDAPYSGAFVAGAGDTPLLITEVEREGEAPCSGHEFMLLEDVRPGETFDNEASPR